mgnify:CR=1 FL=1
MSIIVVDVSVFLVHLLKQFFSSIESTNDVNERIIIICPELNLLKYFFINQLSIKVHCSLPS